jgi:hypothetical protein
VPSGGPHFCASSASLTAAAAAVHFSWSPLLQVIRIATPSAGATVTRAKLRVLLPSCDQIVPSPPAHGAVVMPQPQA